jgi:hypothetical protein
MPFPPAPHFQRQRINNNDAMQDAARFGADTHTNLAN